MQHNFGWCEWYASQHMKADYRALPMREADFDGESSHSQLHWKHYDESLMMRWHVFMWEVFGDSFFFFLILFPLIGIHAVVPKINMPTILFLFKVLFLFF